MRSVPLHWANVSGRPLLEWTEYEGIALWWFVHNDFQRMRARRGSEKAGGRAPERRAHRSPFPRGRLLEVAHLAYQIFASALGHLLSTRTPPREFGRERILIISQNDQWRAVRDRQDGSVRPGDAFFDPIIDELTSKGRYDLVTSYPLTAPGGPWYYPLPSLRQVLRRRREAKIPHRVFDTGWSRTAWQHARHARARFRSIWSRELNLEELRDLESEDRRSDEVLHRLAHYFNTVFGRVVGLLETAHRLLETERPDLVVLMYEYGRFERAVVVAARLRGIPVLAIQHGVIHPTHPGYIFSPDEVSGSGSVQTPFCPLPDLTAVYGPYHKKLLTGVSAYPPEAVVVTGQPRYDLLARAEKWYDRHQTLLELHLDPAKRTVLWATQTHGLPADENMRNVETVYRALAGLENAQLVVKLHPHEDQGASLYRRDSSYAPAIVGRDGDTLALLYACDVLITRHSTVAMEAVALDRPVVILNLSGEPDPVDYVREGVAVGVYRRGELLGALRQLLDSDAPLAGNRKRYIERNLYRVDGKATERVVEVIDTMLGGGEART